METPQTRTGSDGLSMELPCLPAEGTLEQDLCKKKKERENGVPGSHHSRPCCWTQRRSGSGDFADRAP